MRNLFFTAICAAAILATSCEKSFDDVAVGGDKAVTLSVKIGLPEMSTRAFADGTKATELKYAVYEVTDAELKKIDNDAYYGTTEIYLKTNLSFTLLKDHKYGLVFWAAAPDDSPYKVEFTESGATMSYNEESGSLSLNSDNNDAFYAYEVVQVTGDNSISVQLFRPFAQINIGTNDFKKAETLGIDTESIASYIQVPASGSLDLVTGKVETSDQAGTVRFEGGVPEGETYPVKGYEYLAMAYVLVGAEQGTIDIEFGYSNDSGVGTTRKIGSVPVRRNYRTNIYGALLTSNLDVNVEIEPDTEGDKNVMLTWDGKTTNEPVYDEGTYTVKGADELAWLASQPDNSFENETIVLENDLDLNGEEFPAFASGVTRSGTTASGTSFRGVFNGNGKTISNAKVVVKDATADHAVGFFASVAGANAAVRDVTFDKIEIVNETAEQAGVVGIVTEGATIENVKVMRGTIRSKEAAGGIVGRVLKSGTVKNCENHADVSTTAHNVGGIVGAAYYNNEGMSITGCDNYGNISGNYGAGGIVGLNTGEVANCNNYGSSVTSKSASVGGIVGEQHASGSITGCTNYADVTGGDAAGTYGAGGIVGWVRYDSSTANYPDLKAITVSGCTNEGKHIKGATGVGGIVGVWYSDGECKENINMAETIEASGNFAAGIVGNSQWTEVDSERGTKDTHAEGLKLTVHDNVSYTAMGDIKANDCTHRYVYINDSRTTEYDNSNPSMTTVGSDEELTAALTSATEGAYIKLKKGEYQPLSYQSNSNFTAQNVTIDCGGAVFTGNESHLNFNETTTIKNATFKNYDEKHTAQNVNSACGAYGYTCGNFENCVFEGESGFRYITITGNTTFKNCQFIATVEHAFHVDACMGTPKVTLIDCTMSGYCPLGSLNITEYEITGCTFSTNDAGFGGVGLRRPTTMTDCKFYIGGKYDHDEIALKTAGMAYVFNNCTVNDAPLTSEYEFAVGAEGIEVTIDQTQYTLTKTGDKPSRSN
ncbi:MAG: hypothetical protein J1D86_06215 [Alistipes sp.]|nr:hypothetical protein [Alistipes sp.]